MSNAELDFRHIDTKELTDLPFPGRQGGEYRVHLSRGAFERMKQHAQTTNEVELCGVLVGHVRRDSIGPYLAITNVIEGQAANNYGAQVTFTHDTWTHINSVMDKEYRDKRIVGWYHTHPGFGIFLSDMDMFIQENFFNQPYQVAIVLETRKESLGCFAWKEGKCEPLSRMWVGDNEVPLTQGEAKPFKMEHSEPEPEPKVVQNVQQPASYGGWASSLLLVLISALVGWLLGGYMTAMETRRLALDVVQSEVYSLLEFAGLNAAAESDFGELKSDVVALRKVVEDGKTDEATEGFKALQVKLDNYQSLYKRDRQQLRNDMAKISAMRGSMTDSILSVKQRQDELQVYLAELYLERVYTVVARAGTEDPAKMSPADRASARASLDRVLSLLPSAKGQIAKTFPELMAAFYPASVPTTTIPAASTTTLPTGEKSGQHSNTK